MNQWDYIEQNLYVCSEFQNNLTYSAYCVNMFSPNFYMQNPIEQPSTYFRILAIIHDFEH